MVVDEEAAAGLDEAGIAGADLDDGGLGLVEERVGLVRGELKNVGAAGRAQAAEARDSRDCSAKKNQRPGAARKARTQRLRHRPRGNCSPKHSGSQTNRNVPG